MVDQRIRSFGAGRTPSERVIHDDRFGSANGQSAPRSSRTCDCWLLHRVVPRIPPVAPVLLGTDEAQGRRCFWAAGRAPALRKRTSVREDRRAGRPSARAASDRRERRHHHPQRTLSRCSGSDSLSPGVSTRPGQEVARMRTPYPVGTFAGLGVAGRGTQSERGQNESSSAAPISDLWLRAHANRARLPQLPCPALPFP